MGKSTGWRLLYAGIIGNELSPSGEKIPTHESQLRLLARLGGWKGPKPEFWNEAWGRACDLTGKSS
jgi:hypothetical protein